MSNSLVDEEAERMLVGACLDYPELLNELDGLTAADLGVGVCATVLDAMLRLEAKRVPVDQITVCELLKDEGKLGIVGGPGALMKMAQDAAMLAVAGAAVVREQVARIRGFALRRRTRDACREIAARAADLAYDPETVALEGSGRLAQVTVQSGVSIGWRSMTDVFREELDKIERIHNGTEPHSEYIETGVLPWDDAIGGVPRRVASWVIAKPGVGKTGLLGTMAFSLSNLGKRVGLLSFEDRASVFPRRLISQVTGHAIRDIMKQGKLSRDELAALWEKVADLEAFTDRISVVDKRGVSAKRAVALMRREHAENGTDIFMVDHMMRMHEWASEQARDVAVQSICVEMCDVADELDAAVIVNAHVKKTDEKFKDERFVRPRIQDIVGGVAVEQQARLIVALWELEPPRKPNPFVQPEEPKPKAGATDEEKAKLAEAYAALVRKQQNAHDKKIRAWEDGVRQAEDYLVATVLKQNQGRPNFDFYLKRVPHAGLISTERPAI